MGLESALRGHPGERLGEVLLHLLARDDGIEEAVFEQELRTLETLGKFLTDGLLDHARTSEANKGVRFGDVQVAKHREAGGDASGGRVGKDGDIRDTGVVHAGETGGSLGELHKGDDALLHAGSTGGGDDDERMTGGEGAVDRSGDGFADDRAHAAAAEAKFHHAEDDVVRAKLANGVDDRVVEAGLALGFGEAFFVWLQVGEVQWVGGAKAKVDQLVAWFKEVFDAGAGVDAKVMAAVRTHLLIGFEFGFEENLAAVRTANPQPLSADGFLRVVDDLMVFAFEPAHDCLPSRRCLDYCIGEETMSGLHVAFSCKSHIFSEMMASSGQSPSYQRFSHILVRLFAETANRLEFFLS